ncbi:MAG: Glycerophosphoryl diester phosphodiesterase [Acidobacteria bacterium]|nr:Glycerophosphoryl diester phosphodiesterase [Acidobacteriota bacterium]
MTGTSPALPLIIGHRGSSAVAPENTLAAFSRSIIDGADGFEFDVRLARDGVPVVIHDATLNRTGLRSGAVAELASAELHTIEVGSSFNQRFPTLAKPEFAKETVPTLRDVFDLVHGSAQILYLEMKGDEAQAHPLAAAVVELIQDYGNVDRIIVESFDLGAISEVKRLAPGIRTAALFEPRPGHPASLFRKMRTVDLALAAGANQIALHRTLAPRRVVDKARLAHLPVVVWTVDNPIWIARALSMGVTALITNDPGTMIRERSRLLAV